MLSHYFKLIWNKKKQNFLLMLEILVAFLVVFGVCSSMVYYYNNYKRPTAFEYKNVWAVSFSNVETGTSRSDSLMMIYEGIRNELQAMPEVKGVSYMSGNFPFSASMNASNVKRGDKEFSAHSFEMDANYQHVMQVKMVSGRWFSKDDLAARIKPMIINVSLKEQIFPGEDAIGKILSQGDAESDKRQVIGVVQDMKDKGDYADSYRGLYNIADTAFFNWAGIAMIRVDPSAGAAFEARLYKKLSSLMKNGSIEIEHLTQKHASKNQQTIIPLVVASVIAGFLIINVALGLFGVLWYNISRRRQEIGLRRAVGATAGSVSGQIISETLLLTTLSVILGLFFAVQFPLLNVFDMPAGVYIAAMVLAVLFIYLLVVICALYPGRQAAAIYPAVALHED